MTPPREVVITGCGLVCPIGLSPRAVWDALSAGASGVARIGAFDTSSTPIHIGAEVRDLDAARIPGHRKALKLMSRDIQLGVVAAEAAWQDARLAAGSVDPDRLGVVFGADMIHCQPAELADAFRRSRIDGRFSARRFGLEALGDVFPLWLLKYIPNMPASHISIVRDARGPNNTITAGDVSSLLAIAEAADVIARGDADAVIAGGASSRIHPWIWMRSARDGASTNNEPPEAVSRPFDAMRTGYVNGEGAAALVLEERRHAERRGAAARARIAGWGMRQAPGGAGRLDLAAGIGNAIRAALASARRSAGDVAFVSAHGLSTIAEDRAEARAIRHVLGGAPVTALKSFFGNAGAGCGAIESAISLLALERGAAPFTLNYEHPDAGCPVAVVADKMLAIDSATALVVNYTRFGQAAALLLERG